MKILNVLPSTDRRLGGTVEAALQVASGLEGVGHVADIFGMTGPEYYSEKLGKSVISGGASASHYGRSRDAVTWLKSHASEYDAILVHGIWQYHALAVRQISATFDIPYFIYPHGMLDPWFANKQPLKHLKKLIYWLLIERINLSRARNVLYTCAEERRLAEKSFPIYGGKSLVCPLGIDVASSSMCESTDIFFEKYPGLEGKKIVLFLGRVDRKKGCDLLIDAFLSVAEMDADLRLVIAGPNDSQYAQDLILRSNESPFSSRIVWTGMLSGSLKWSAIRACSLFVLPSHQENFGIAVVEAMALGANILISDRVNIFREIIDADAALLCSDDFNSVSKMLKTWLKLTETERNAMSENAKLCFKNRFEARKTIPILLNVLELTKKPAAYIEA